MGQGGDSGCRDGGDGHHWIGGYGGDGGVVQVGFYAQPSQLEFRHTDCSTPQALFRD